MRLLLLISGLALVGCASTPPKQAGQPPKQTTQASKPKATQASTAKAAKPKTAQASKPKTAHASKPPTVLASKSQAAEPPKPPTAPASKVETGQASFYSSKHHGQPTASGELYDETQLTAAHRTLPFGTRVRVTNLENQRSAVFRINDRGPFIKGRVVDVSKRGAFELGFIQEGVASVRVEVVGS